MSGQVMGESPSQRSPRVSVIIPTRNRPELLPRAVASVLTQTFRDFEILIVDDASADDAARVVAGQDPRIRYVRHDIPKEACGARNTGIRLARGEFVGFLDDDDEWLPEKLERQVRLFEGSPPDVGVVYTGVRRIRPSRRGRRMYDEPAGAAGDIYQALFGDMRQLPVNTATLLVRKACFDDVGLFDEELTYGEAWDIHVRLAKRWKFAAIPEILAVIHHESNGISSDPRRVIAGRRRDLEKHRPEIEKWPRCHSRFHITLGVLELRVGNIRQARRDLLQAIAAWPFNVRAIMYYLLSFQPRAVRQAFVSLWRRSRPLWQRG